MSKHTHNNLNQILSNLSVVRTEYEAVDRILHIHGLLTNYKLSSTNTPEENELLTVALDVSGETWKAKLAYKLAELCFLKQNITEEVSAYTNEFEGTRLEVITLNYLFGMLVGIIERQATEMSDEEYNCLNGVFVAMVHTTSAHRVYNYCNTLISSIRAGFIKGESVDHNPELTEMYK